MLGLVSSYQGSVLAPFFDLLPNLPLGFTLAGRFFGSRSHGHVVAKRRLSPLRGETYATGCLHRPRPDCATCGGGAEGRGCRGQGEWPKWLVKNPYPKWSHGKRNQRLNPAVPWWFYFDPYPYIHQTRSRSGAMLTQDEKTRLII